MMDRDHSDWTFAKCDSCGLVFLDPRVDVDELHRFYTSSYIPYRGASAWGRYAALVQWDLSQIDKKRVSTVRKYSNSSRPSILDVGCGHPSFLYESKKRIGNRCIGLDFSDSGWRGDNRFRSLDLRVGEVDTLVLDEPVDVITMWHYLEHDYDPHETLKALRSHCQKDGLLLIEVPNHDSYSRKRYGRYWAGYHTPRHTALYTVPTLTTLLERSGWKVKDAYEYGTLDPYTLDWMSRMEMRGLDWEGSMEREFVSFVGGKLIRPRYFFPKWTSLGFMTVVAQLQ